MLINFFLIFKIEFHLIYLIITLSSPGTRIVGSGPLCPQHFPLHAQTGLNFGAKKPSIASHALSRTVIDGWVLVFVFQEHCLRHQSHPGLGVCVLALSPSERYPSY